MSYVYDFSQVTASNSGTLFKKNYNPEVRFPLKIRPLPTIVSIRKMEKCRI